MRVHAPWLHASHRYQAIGLGWLTVVVALWTAQTTHAEDSLHLRGNRLVHRFDFEEAKHNNFENLPMHWFVMGRPADTANPTFLRQPLHQTLISMQGFPRHCEVRFDRPQIQPGPHRLYLGLDSGSAGAFLEIGAVPAVPGSDYLMTASIRTKDLDHAAAKLIAYFVDSGGNRIDASVVATDKIRSEADWTQVSINLRGDFPEAAWIGMQVELIQPKAEDESRLGQHQVVYRDVYGHAWFDDIAIWQLPRMAVRTQSVVNVITQPDKPRLNMRIRDLTGQELIAQASIYDHRHRLIAQDRQSVGRGLSESWYWDPPLNRFGWYLVDLAAFESQGSPRQPVARSLSAFIWLPAEKKLPLTESQRFFIFAEDIAEDQLALLPSLLEGTGIGSLLISAWNPQDKEGDLERRQTDVDGLIQQAQMVDGQVIISFSPLPRRLASDLDVDMFSPISVFAHRENAWMGYLSPVLLRQGQMVRQWQMGGGDRAELYLIPDLPQVIESVRQVFKDWAPNPLLVLPWHLIQPRRTDLDSDLIYAMEVPYQVRPDTLDQYMQEWDSIASSSVRLNLRVPPASQLAHPKRIEDVALRMLYGWRTNVAGLALTRPWTVSNGRPLTLVPDPVLGAFASIKHRLAGRRVIGEIPIVDGVRAMILDGLNGSAIAAWNESATPPDAKIDLYLGPSPIVYDVWGNRKDLELHSGRHRLALTTTPVFIEGIDSQLALLRASFKLEPSFIESTGVPHNLLITFTNPWPRTMAGKLTIRDPVNWEITPRVHSFSLPPGATASLPVRMRFPVSEIAGDKRLVARFEFAANDRYDVEMATSMEMGLKDVDLDASIAWERNPKTGRLDAVVTQVITNTGDEAQSLNVFAIMSGQTRQERMLASIDPGQTVVRRFRFEGAGESAGSTPVRVGVRQVSGPAILNQLISIEE